MWLGYIGKILALSSTSEVWKDKSQRIIVLLVEKNLLSMWLLGLRSKEWDVIICGCRSWGKECWNFSLINVPATSFFHKPRFLALFYLWLSSHLLLNFHVFGNKGIHFSIGSHSALYALIVMVASHYYHSVLGELEFHFWCILNFPTPHCKKLWKFSLMIIA